MLVFNCSNIYNALCSPSLPCLFCLSLTFHFLYPCFIFLVVLFLFAPSCSLSISLSLKKVVLLRVGILPASYNKDVRTDFQTSSDESFGKSPLALCQLGHCRVDFVAKIEADSFIQGHGNGRRRQGRGEQDKKN